MEEVSNIIIAQGKWLRAARSFTFKMATPAAGERRRPRAKKLPPPPYPPDRDGAPLLAPREAIVLRHLASYTSIREITGYGLPSS